MVQTAAVAWTMEQQVTMTGSQVHTGKGIINNSRDHPLLRKVTVTPHHLHLYPYKLQTTASHMTMPGIMASHRCRGKQTHAPKWLIIGRMRATQMKRQMNLGKVMVVR
jgi:hypothetical protein